MSESKIEWTDATWNPVRGCVKVSPGCKNCYAETFAERWRGIPGHPYEQGFNLRLVPEKLTEPLKWKKPRKIFVNSMSDLFQDGLPDEYIDRCIAVMAQTPHVYQVLTKRAGRMMEYSQSLAQQTRQQRGVRIARSMYAGSAVARHIADDTPGGMDWPLPNVWLGVSAENQEWADRRIPLLLQTPAAVRFVSYEPALSGIDFRPWLTVTRERDRMLDWIIVGGESGPGARPFDVSWARSVVQQCKAAKVPLFVKQLGADPREGNANGHCSDVNCTHPDCGWIKLKLNSRKGGDPEEWAEELRVRQFPISQIGAKA